MTGWQKVLTDVVNRPEIHGRFLNTLSLLEYIGARKIMKSQDEARITPITLAHMTEEIRHAQIIKKLALKVGGDGVKTYSEDSLICGHEARAYIQAIDSAAASVVGPKNSWINYLLTTLVIEERAQELYPFYDELLIPLGLGGPLRAIFREEEGHLEQVITALKENGKITETQLELVRQEERIYFTTFFAAVAERMLETPGTLSEHKTTILS